jgi:hypothetical protein
VGPPVVQVAQVDVEPVQETGVALRVDLAGQQALGLLRPVVVTLSAERRRYGALVEPHEMSSRCRC